MEYSERYKTLTVRFTVDEWDRFTTGYLQECEENDMDISKHRYIKALIRRALNKGNGKIKL